MVYKIIPEYNWVSNLGAGGKPKNGGLEYDFPFQQGDL